MCETFNGIILEARHKAIITMLEDIRQYCMTRIVVKRENTAKWKSSCGPRICARIEKERVKSGKWQVEWSGGAKHEVFWDNLFFHAREGYVVLLENHNCSCRKWDKTGIPCQHALAALAFQGLDPLEYIAHWFKKETYLKAYQFPVNPLRGRAFWVTSEEGPLLPPIVKKMPGRPATKRRREPMEPRNKSKTNISREGRVMTCSICHTKGHNKARCAQRTNVATNPQAGPQNETISTGNEGSSRGKRPKASVIAAVRGPMQTFRNHSGGIIVGREVRYGFAFITASELLERRHRNLRENNAKLAQQSCTSMESPPATDIEFLVFSTHASTTEPTAEANQRLADCLQTEF
ncbi:uncharacterized protein LOC120270379 [Dioscorea cayenensis subsp. rotundata]|uniref:Uncharacterized protein LOC120270379 n=1 Tax=Dioscorea cayennensis subsp. rotundata TaxID=55577 RepID=A0AB40C2S1_DIOCR|nr:uncharacterized protein LOC120270379 [Dioscorea cayenensis subsp. rotundata]